MLDLDRVDPQSRADGPREFEPLFERFEAAWKQGKPPAIGDFLPAHAAGRTLVLVELVHMDLEWRFKRGQPAGVETYFAEFPELADEPAVAASLIAAEFELRRAREPNLRADEFFGRFPSYQKELAALLYSNPTDPAPNLASTIRHDRTAVKPAANSADRNLLFGILALQNGFVDGKQLIAAMNAWALEKGRPLGEVLVRQQAFGGDELSLMDALVVRHLAKHGGDPEKSLGAVSSIESLRGQLRDLADPEIEKSLAYVSQGRWQTRPDVAADQTASSTESTSAGQRFRIVRLHAKGGLGEVFVAEDEELRRNVALKQIQSRFADDPNSRARFVLEAEITGGLEHPGIVPIYGLGTYANGRPFYAMRFIQGDSLKDAIERYHAVDPAKLDVGERAIQFRKLLGRFIDVCNAIEYAHSRGVLHRDLKPGNIMLGKYGETLVVDWGLAKAMGRPDTQRESAETTLRPSGASGSTPTQVGSAVGTPQFMSPEQAAGRLDQLGPASDVYSLGATLYTLLTGRAPLSHLTGRGLGEILKHVERGEISPPRQLNPEISPPLDAICRKAMAISVADRYGSPKLLAEDIEHWLADEPVSAQPERLAHRAGRWMRRHRSWTMAGAAVLLIAALAATAATVLVNREKKVAEGLADDNLALAERERTSKMTAEAARDEAEIQRKKAVANEREAKFIAAQTVEDRALAILEQSNSSAGILSLARALELAPPEDAGLQYSLRANFDRWRPAAPKLTAMLRHSKDGALIRAVVFSRDGQFIATAGGDSRVVVWDARSAKPVCKHMQHGDSIPLIAFGPDGKTLITGEGRKLPDSKTVHLWNTQTGEMTADLDFEDPVRLLSVSRDGRVLLAASNSSFRLWKLPEAEPLGPRSAFSGAPIRSGSDYGSSRMGHRRYGKVSVAMKDIAATPAESVIALSPDGHFVAYAGAERGSVVVWSADKQAVASRATPVGIGIRPILVTFLVFSPDSKLVASGGTDNTTRLWNVATGKQHGALASGGTNDLWKAATGAEQGPEFAPPELESQIAEPAIRELAFSADGKFIATASRDKTARVWDVQTGDPVGPPLRHSGSVESVAFNPNGTRLLTGSLDHTVQEWDVQSGRPIGQSLPHGDSVWDVEYSPDGRQFITASFDSFVRLWQSAPSEAAVKRLSHRSPISALRFSAANDKLVSTSLDGNARIWDVASGAPIGGPLSTFDRSIHAIEFSPDAQRLVIASGSFAFLWDVKSGEQVANLQVGLGTPLMTAFSSDGSLLVSGGVSASSDAIGAVPPHPTPRAPHPRRSRSAPPSVSGSPPAAPAAAPPVEAEKGAIRAAQEPAIAKRVSRILCWNAKSGECMGGVEWSRNDLQHLRFSPDSSRIVAVMSNGENIVTPVSEIDRTMVRFRAPDAPKPPKAVKPAKTSRATRAIKATTVGYSSPILVAVSNSGGGRTRISGHSSARANSSPSTRVGHFPTVVSPNGSFIATELDDGVVSLKSIKHPEQPPLRLPHHDRILCLAFSPDEKLLLTSAGYEPENRGEVRLWDTATGEPSGLPLENRDLILAAAFSPDGKCVATGSSSGAVRLWDVATGRAIGPANAQAKAIRAVAFNSDGTILAAGSDDGEIVLWPTPKPIGDPPSDVRRNIEISLGAALDKGGAIKLLNPEEWELLHAGEFKAPPPPPSAAPSAMKSASIEKSE